MTPSTKATLPAPSVKEADGEFLRADMMPLGPTVAILYANMKAGDRITLFWDCKDSVDGNGRFDRTLVADNEECRIVVPFITLLAAETFEVVARYVVRRSGSTTDEESEAAPFSVRNYEELQWLYIYDERGKLLNPSPNTAALIDVDADWFEVGFDDVFSRSLETGDTVFLWLRGSAVGAVSTQLQDASQAMSVSITDHILKPVRFRFSRRIVVGNYGDQFVTLCRVVRRSGYIQHDNYNGIGSVGRNKEPLTQVRTPDLIGRTLYLDDPKYKDGLKVSVINQFQTEEAMIKFFVDGSSSEAYAQGSGPVVYGLISRQTLEQHVDNDCALYCEAVKVDPDGHPTSAYSPRGQLTIRRSLDPDPFPTYDDSLESPRIDGLTSTLLSVARYPSGVFARVPHGGGISEGDVVTLVFRTLDGLLTWRKTTHIAAGNTGEDIVHEVDMTFLSYSQDLQGWLYYSIRSPSGGERFSPALSVYIDPYVPHLVYAISFRMRSIDQWDFADEISPDHYGQFMFSRQNIRLHVGDQLIITLRGYRADTSMQIHIAIDDESRNPLWIDLPAEVARMNAGHKLNYRASMLSGSYIEHTPWMSLSILEWPGQGDREPTKAAPQATLSDIHTKASALPRRFLPTSFISLTGSVSLSQQSDL